jgi:hypothetical protein
MRKLRAWLAACGCQMSGRQNMPDPRGTKVAAVSNCRYDVMSMARRLGPPARLASVLIRVALPLICRDQGRSTLPVAPSVMPLLSWKLTICDHLTASACAPAYSNWVDEP